MNDLRIIDAHSHLWLKQDTVVDGMRIRALANGRSEFMGELRQMLPPHDRREKYGRSLLVEYGLCTGIGCRSDTGIY